METAAPAPAEAAPAKKKQSEAVVIIASSVGSVFEWYDFFLYGTLLVFINKHFYTGVDETTGYILALGTFSAGFVVRPFGALVFGWVGDMFGRKSTFLIAMIIMGASTFLVGFLPGAAWFQSTMGAGVIAPIILVVLRVLQGLAVGGQYGGAVTYVAEHAPMGKRGLYTSWIQITATVGLLASLVLIIVVRANMTTEAFADWGWRIPFILSIFLLIGSILIRRLLDESPVYAKMKAAGAQTKAPFAEAFGKWSNLKYVLIALFGAVAGQACVWYSGTLYGLFFLQKQMKLPDIDAYTIMAVALAVGTPAYVFFGWLSDKIGRKPLVLLGLILPCITYAPIFPWSVFHQITNYSNPAMARALETNRVIVEADTTQCSLQFDPVGKTNFTDRSCDIVKSFLSNNGVNYDVVAKPPGTVARVLVGEQAFTSPDPAQLTGAARRTAITAFQAQVGGALKTAGYTVSDDPTRPAFADHGQINHLMVIGLVALTTIFTAMIYGPMAAMLVELFPARIRYTSLSLPYHIGNGWFGGLLPTTAFMIVAATGNIFAGLWYPVVVAGFTFVIALFFLPETYKRDIHH
jgi:MFS family permease